MRRAFPSPYTSSLRCRGAERRRISDRSAERDDARRCPLAEPAAKAWGGFVRAALAAVVVLLCVAPAFGQSERERRSTATAADGTVQREDLSLSNPISVLDGAARALPLGQGTPDTAARGAPPREGDLAQGMTSAMSVLILLTVLTVAPAILIMCTSFVRIIVVLALLRQAIGAQQLPPAQVLTGLSLFMTILVMAPTLDRLNTEFIQPMQAGAFVSHGEAWDAAKTPIREFMFDQIDYAGNWSTVYMIMNYRGLDTSRPEELTYDDVDTLTLIPAFILSELKVAFLMGFRLYLPFLIIDMIIASILISMGMMMLPPVLISLPFKLLLFVLVDGWELVVGSLLNSFAVPGVTT